MRKKLTILIALLIVVGALFMYGMRVGTFYAFHADACHVIALGIAGRMADNGAVSDHEVQVTIGQLISASVIHGCLGADGVPTDLHGNPFIIQRDANQVSVATEWSVWQPFRIKRVVKVESHNKSLQADAAPPRP